MWSAFECFQSRVGRALACLICCCGIFPTKDWGQNQRTIGDLLNHVNSQGIPTTLISSPIASPSQLDPSLTKPLQDP